MHIVIRAAVPRNRPVHLPLHRPSGLMSRPDNSRGAPGSRVPPIGPTSEDNVPRVVTPLL